MPSPAELDIEELLHDEETPLPFKYSITSYGADYPIDALIRRIRDGSLYVPDFQRRYVWSLRDASRFVESLLLGLPVPGIFLAREEESQRLLVIDGHQRLTSLRYFYEGIFEPTARQFRLKGVQPQFHNLTYTTLKSEDRRRLDDSIIHATIVRQDAPPGDNSSIYLIFERLNTGGVLLSPQEIRSVIFRGEFNELIKLLDSYPDWRSIIGLHDKRLRDQELILRFLALYFNSHDYKKPFKAFLNDYMGKNRHLSQQPADICRRAFEPTISLVKRCLGRSAFRRDRSLNAALFDAVMVALARRLEHGDIENCEQLRQAHAQLLENDLFLRAISRATSDEDSVRTRLEIATDMFARVV